MRADLGMGKWCVSGSTQTNTPLPPILEIDVTKPGGAGVGSLNHDGGDNGRRLCRTSCTGRMSFRHPQLCAGAQVEECAGLDLDDMTVPGRIQLTVEGD